MAVIVIFCLNTKSNFFGKTFLYTHKVKKSILFKNGILKKAQKLSALLSNKNEICASLLNNCGKKSKYFSARHNSMTKWCSALFKCENKLKINAQLCSALKLGGVLGWNKSINTD